MASLPLTSAHPRRAALAIAGAAGLSAALLVLWIVGNAALAAGFLAAALVAVGVILAWRVLGRSGPEAAPPVDWTVARAVAAASQDAVAITDRSGHLVCANDRYEALFGGFPTPPALPLDHDGATQLGTAGRAAWRDGQATLPRIQLRGTALVADITRAGEEQDMLVWRFGGGEAIDRLAQLGSGLDGALGDRLGAAGIMAALVTPEGHVLAANRILTLRASGSAERGLGGRDIARYLITDGDGGLPSSPSRSKRITPSPSVMR